MSRHAVVNEVDLVTNVIEYEPDSDWPVPEGSRLVRTDTASPGDTLVGREFVRPTPAPAKASWAKQWNVTSDADDRIQVLVDLLGLRSILEPQQQEDIDDAARDF